MRIWGPICVLICCVALVSYYWQRLEDRSYDRRWFVTWLIKGVVLPIFVWVLLNSGHTPVMPAVVKLPPPTVGSGGFSPLTLRIRPFGPPISATKPTVVGPIGYVAIQTGPALVAVGSFWAALTLGWLVAVYARRAEERRMFITCSLVWCALMFPFTGLLMFLYGLGGMGFGLLLWFWPIMRYATLLEPTAEPLPSYTQAVVNLKFGKYAEAEQAIINELEKSENDFEGWMMLAELYAKQFNDLEEAERTVREVCNQPNITVSHISVALHKLADWQLKFRGDPVAAQRALEEICKKMPNTHLATMARHRLNQLPATAADWNDQQHGRSVVMPALNDDLDEPSLPDAPEANPAEALSLANQCVDKLKRDPNDVTSREELARIFAERLGQSSLALEQLELLIEMPGQPPEKMVGWLGLAAAWNIKYRGDKAAAQKFLKRLIRDFPQSAQAFAAQRRLSLIEMEARSPAVP